MIVLGAVNHRPKFLAQISGQVSRKILRPQKSSFRTQFRARFRARLRTASRFSSLLAQRFWKNRVTAGHDSLTSESETRPYAILAPSQALVQACSKFFWVGTMGDESGATDRVQVVDSDGEESKHTSPPPTPTELASEEDHPLDEPSGEREPRIESEPVSHGLDGATIARRIQGVVDGSVLSPSRSWFLFGRRICG